MEDISPARRAPRASKLRLVLTCACACALAAGCSTLAPQRRADLPAVPVPAQWQSVQAQAAQTASTPAAPDAPARDWWRAFGDAQLSALIERALQANASVEQAQANVRRARALVAVQAAGLAPQLNADASAQRSKTSGFVARNSYSVGLDASWEADLFGAQRSAVDAASADAQAAAIDLGDTQVSLAAEVALAYQQWAGTKARLAVARENLAAQEETLQITAWRTQAGLASSLQLEQARTATEQTRAQIPALESTLAQTAHALAVLTGRAPGALPELQASAATQAPAASQAVAATIPADTLRQRPDVRRAEAQVQAAAARAQQAQADRLPSLRLSGNIGLSALTIGALGSSGSGVGALLASLSAPLFDGGARRAQGEAQDAALAAARAAWRASVLGALRDVENALVALASAQQRRGTLDRAAEAAAQAALLARDRYRSGLIDFQVVLDTQRTLLSAQDSLVAAQTDVAQAQVQLIKALGGGWRSDLAADTPAPRT
ncbi:MAG: efflux transporter outer membrane subunit [Burkholderiaceae bacterium]